MINVGVIGTGTVAQLMHLPILHDLKDMFSIQAVSDVSASVLGQVSQKYGARAYGSPLELIDDKSLDAILILSPDQYHAQYAKASIEAGKHVFVEKPVTLNMEQLEELIALEKAHSGTVCMVGYMRRYASGYLKCKELLQADARKVEYMRFRDIILEGDYYINQTRPAITAGDIPEEIISESNAMRREQIGRALGEGCTEQQRISYQMLTGLGCHTLSAVRELVGMPLEVKSVAVDNEHLVAVFQYDGFLAVYEIINDQEVVQFDASIEIYQKDRRMHVKYETPYLRYQPHCLTVVESTATDTKTTAYGPDYRDAFETELRDFYNCIQNKSAPKTSFADSIDDLKLFRQICDKI